MALDLIVSAGMLDRLIGGSEGRFLQDLFSAECLQELPPDLDPAGRYSPESHWIRRGSWIDSLVDLL